MSEALLGGMSDKEGRGDADATAMDDRVDHRRKRYPHSIVWTPIPCLTWFFPFIGHMGIATSSGVIRDFAGPYWVSEDDMAFGWPSRYLQLDLADCPGGSTAWDKVGRDFAGPYWVSEDDMAFGWPSRYLQLDLADCPGGSTAWDKVGRDFSGPYWVSEDDMAFGWPSRYLQLDLADCPGGSTAWDKVGRDFAGPYWVSEDDMAFGWPSRYLQLDLADCPGGSTAWDKAVAEASEEYGRRMHNLCCDNCHSHVAMALNLMRHRGSESWNMVWLALHLFLRGRYVGVLGFLKQWLPFLVVVGLMTTVAVLGGYVS